MFVEGGAVGQDVIYQLCAEDVEEIKQCVVDEMLEGGGLVTATERHDFILVVAESSSKRGFPFIPFGYPDKVVGIGQVEFGVLLS